MSNSVIGNKENQENGLIINEKIDLVLKHIKEVDLEKKEVISLIVKLVTSLSVIDIQVLISALMSALGLTDADLSSGVVIASSNTSSEKKEDEVVLTKEVTFAFKSLSDAFNKVKATKVYKEFASKFGQTLGLGEIMKKFEGDMAPFEKVERSVAEEYQKSFAECGVVVELI